MKASKTLKSALLSPWMEVEEGMLLVIPSKPLPRPRPGTASGGLPGACEAAADSTTPKPARLAGNGPRQLAKFAATATPHPKSTDHAIPGATPPAAQDRTAGLRPRKTLWGQYGPNAHRPLFPFFP